MEEEKTVTVESDQPFEAFTATVNLLRGAIVTNFSHVEFLFADIYFRAMRLAEYKDLSRTLPYTLASRIAAVKKLATMPGPISKYQAELLAIADQLKEYEQLRQFMAHGLLVVYPENDGDHKISFRMYNQPSRHQILLGTMSCGAGSMANIEYEIKKHALKVVELFSRIFHEVPLPQVQ